MWLWWAGALPGLSERAADAIERSDRIGVCTISCWEVAMLAGGGRIRLEDDVPRWVARALAAEKVETLGLEPAVAVAAGLLGRDVPGDPADRIIYATARTHDAPLVTKDRQLRRYDPALTLW